MKEVLTTLVGFIFGIMGSYIWWRYLLRLKPKVKISDKVAKGFNYITPKEVVYRIKLINFGNRQVIELNATAWIVERRNNRWTPDRKLKLEYEGELPALGRKSAFGDVSSRISPIFYMNILDETNLESDLHEERRLHFTLSAKDALSGTAVVQRKVYSLKDIKEGDFEIGFTCNFKAIPLES